MSIETPFTKDNLNTYLSELAKEYKKRSGGMVAEIVLIGGASVLVNYGFRDMTYDIDAAYRAPSVMKEAINAVEDKFNLQTGWLNNDFEKTSSYTEKLYEVSEYYRTFSNVLQVRTVKAEYLVAMKLVSGRQYKKDLSDIIGILREQQHIGKPLDYEMIDRAVIRMYGSWDRVSDFSKEFLMKALETCNLEQLYKTIFDEENEVRDAVIEFDEKYPKKLNSDNINDIIASAKAKKKRGDKGER